MVELGLREKCQHAKTTPDRNLAVARVRTWDVNAIKTERERESEKEKEKEKESVVPSGNLTVYR